MDTVAHFFVVPNVFIGSECLLLLYLSMPPWVAVTDIYSNCETLFWHKQTENLSQTEYSVHCARFIILFYCFMTPLIVRSWSHGLSTTKKMCTFK